MSFCCRFGRSEEKNTIWQHRMNSHRLPNFSAIRGMYEGKLTEPLKQTCNLLDEFFL